MLFCIFHASFSLYHSLVIPTVPKCYDNGLCCPSSYLNPPLPTLTHPSVFPFLPSLRYYAEYYQQLQQYPQFQYAYPPPSTMTAIPGMPGVSAVPAVPTMSAQQVTTLDALRPVVPTAAAMAAAMAAPRVYEPPLPPPRRKEAILRRPELSLHTPEPPFR